MRAKAARQTGDLRDIEIGPGHSHSTVRLPPGLPPLPAPADGVVETEDEAGSDSPTEQGREILEETSPSPSPSPSPQQPSEQPDPVPEQSSAMPSLPQIEPSSQLAGDDAGTVDKRPLEEGETSPRMKKRTSKIHFDMKTNTHKVVYTDVEEPAKKAKPLPLNIARSDAGGVKHAGEAASSGRPEKSSRTGEGLSSSPTFAGNINQVKTYSGIDLWVDDEEPFEAGFEEDIEKSVSLKTTWTTLIKCSFLQKQMDRLICLLVSWKFCTTKLALKRSRDCLSLTCWMVVMLQWATKSCLIRGVFSIGVAVMGGVGVADW